MRLREPVRRLLLTGVYSGTRPMAAAVLSWRRHPYRGYVDLERGVLHRAGYAEPVKPGKRRMTSVMRMELLTHMRGWYKRDSREGIPNVVWQTTPPDRGKPYVQFPYNLWWQVVHDAGMTESADPHVWNQTAITWLGQDGYGVEDAADITGRSPVTVNTYYRQHNLAGQFRALRACRLPVRKHVEVVPVTTDDRPKRSQSYLPRVKKGRHKPPLPRVPWSKRARVKAKK